MSHQVQPPDRSTPVRTLYLASNNRHKQAELAQLAGPGWSIHLARELKPDIHWEETGQTFLENARIKALVVQAQLKQKGATLGGACILADDSGLAVKALGGAPGIYSSRYAGPGARDLDNNMKLLEDLSLHQAPSQRLAQFICQLVFIDEAAAEHHYRGVCPGHIHHQLQGPNGFGYDPLFIPSAGQQRGSTRTMAELSPAEKNQLSHRRQAVDAWLQDCQRADAKLHEAGQR